MSFVNFFSGNLSSDFITLDDHQLACHGYEVTKAVDQNSWTEVLRLAASFLYAIQNGAKLIYLTDERLILPPTAELKTNNDNLRLIYPYNSSCSKDCMLYNPLIHFGQPIEPYGWIRDYGSHDSAGRYYVLNKTYPGVKHFIVSNNLDTKAPSDSRYGVDTVAPPVVLSPRLYSPFLFTNTLFSYETFWGLFIGRLKYTESTQILSSYWIQTLMKYINADVTFDSMAESKPHEFRKIKDIVNERQFGKYMRVLSSWKCKYNRLDNCVGHLSQHLLSFENSYHTENDSTMLSLWLKDLVKVGYKFPEIVQRNTVELANNSLSDILLFHPSEIRFKSESSLPLANISRLKSTLRQVCGDSLPKYNFTYKLNATFKPMFPKLLMILTFNLKHLRVLPLLEIIYKVQFPNVIVCANGDDDRELANEWRYSLYSTKTYRYMNTTNSPECISRVLKLGYKVTGIIHIQDDIVFNYWNVINWDWNKIWSLPIVQTLDLYSADSFKRDPYVWWYPADSIIGAAEVLHLLKISTENETVRHKCYKNLMQLHGAIYKYSYALCDIFYIPARLASSFAEIVGEFANRDVWLEMAVPNTLNCVERLKEHVGIPQAQILNANNQSWMAFQRYVEYLSKPYYHPFKLEPLLYGKIDRRNMFCKEVVKQAMKFW
ncbi:Uncharacterised protein g11134 [Pycnogonum litorale]